MTAKSKTSKSSKSRVSKQSKKSTDKRLFWAFGVLLVVIVAVAGIVWYRQSQAAGARVVGYWNTSVAGGITTDRNGYTDGFTAAGCSNNCRFVAAGTFSSGAKKWISGRSTCQLVTRRNSKYGASYNLRLQAGDPITIYWTDGCW